jgi:hypothetical protein
MMLGLMQTRLVNQAMILQGYVAVHMVPYGKGQARLYACPAQVQRVCSGPLLEMWMDFIHNLHR